MTALKCWNRLMDREPKSVPTAWPVRTSGVNGAVSVELEDLSRFEGEGGREGWIPDLVDGPPDNGIWRRPRGAALPSTSKGNHAMKLNLELIEKNSESVVIRAPERKQQMGESEESAKASIPKYFRRLKWNEVVNCGDFVADAQRGFEPWEGPGGFRAGTLVKPVYRREENQPTATKITNTLNAWASKSPNS